MHRPVSLPPSERHHPPHAHGSPGQALLVWLLLMLATVLAWQLGEHGAGGPHMAVLLIAAALFKGSLIILEYMAIRHAPWPWRILLLGWLIGVCALILMAYWKGRSA